VTTREDAIRSALRDVGIDDTGVTPGTLAALSELSGRSIDVANAFKNAGQELDGVNEELATLTERAEAGASALDAMASSGRGALSGMISAFSTAAKEGMDGIDETYKALGILGEEKIDLYTQLQATLGGDFRTQLTQFNEGATELQFQVGGVIKEMYKDFYTEGYRQFFGSAEEFMGYASEIYLSVGSGLAAMRDLGSDASQQIEEAAMMARGLGFSSTEMMDMMDARMSHSGEFSTQILREVTAHSALVSQATGDSQKAIARGMYEMMTDVQTFGETSAEVAARTAGSLRELGLEMRDLAAVTNKYLNFDSASESLANLNTVFGMQLDTMAMMEAANRDPMEAMNMLRDSFLATGEDFRTMSLTQQRLLAEQAGLEIEAAKRLFDPTAQITSMEQLQDAAAEMEVPTGAEAIASLADEIARVPRLQGEFTDAVFNQIAMNDLAGVTDQAAQAQAALTDFALGVGSIDQAKKLLPPHMQEELQDTVTGIKELVSDGGMLDSVTSGLGAVTGDAQRLPGDIADQMTTSQALAAARSGGQEFGDQIIAGIESRTSTHIPTIGEITTYVDAQGNPLPGQGYDVDDVIVTDDGTILEPSDDDTLVALANEGGAMQNLVTTLGESLNFDLGPATARAGGTAGNITELVDAITRSIEALRTGTGGATPTPEAAAERPINLNLTLNLAGRRLAELKDMLLTSPGVNGVDFEKTISD